MSMSIIGQVAATGTLVDAAADQVLVSSIICHNIDTVAQPFYICLCKTGVGAIPATNGIYRGIIPPKETFIVVAGLTLGVNETIKVNGTNITFTASGYRMDSGTMRILGQTNSAAAAIVSVGAGLQQVIGTLMVFNSDAVNAKTFTLHQVKVAPATPDNSNAIMNHTLQPYESLSLIAGLTLGAGESLWAASLVDATLVFTASGEESAP